MKRGRNNDIIFIIFNSPRKAVISAVPNVADVWTLESRVANNPSVFKKASTRAFTWLKEPTSTFTLKTLLRYYAKQVPKHGK